MDDRRLLLPLALALLVVGGTGSALWAATPKPRAVPKTGSAAVAAATISPKLARRLRSVTWHWQIVMGRRRSRSAVPLDTRRALRFWRRQARLVRLLAAHPPHRRGWLCIHRFEGGWRDSGDPYWGGLQMDRGFMSRYAPRLLLRRGWANRWSPLEQMWVAEHAHHWRGYTPWPNTARYCGLL